MNNALGADGPGALGSTRQTHATTGSYAPLRAIPITRNTTLSDIRRIILLGTTGPVPRGVARRILFGTLWHLADNASDGRLSISDGGRGTGIMWHLALQSMPVTQDYVDL